MKPISKRLMPLLALVSGLAMMPAANAATANEGDIFLGFRAKAGTGSNKTYMINLGAATQFETATQAIKLPLGGVGADLTSVYGSSWNTSPNVLWGVAGTVGSFNAIGTNPAKTVYGSRDTATAWLRANEATQGAATNSLNALATAFKTSSAVGTTATNAVLQTTTDINSWSSYQPDGVNAGPEPGTSFAFFNPSIEASFGNNASGATLHLYRVKPATAGQIGTAGDYLGRFLITNSAEVTFVPVSAFGVNSIAFSSATYSVSESTGTLDVTVTRSGDFSSAASVTIGATNGTATSSTDYTFAGGVVNFAAGEATKTQTVTILTRPGYQTDRSFTLTLSSPSGATLGTVASTSVTITEPLEPSEINLVDAQVNVFAEQPSVTINLSRSGGSAQVTVDISTEDDTAVAGTDYTAPAGAAKTVTFAAGATEASATIALTSAAITVNKSFKVKLTNAGANASVGTADPTETVVNLLAVDAIVPTVAITAPAVNFVVPAGQTTVQVSGTSSDNLGVAKVLFSLNGGSFADVSVNSSGSWNRTVTPVGGTNVVQVKAVDARGNESSVVSRSFSLVKKGPLTVTSSNVAQGAVSGGLTGATAYEVGKTYTVKATPKANFAFAGWTGAGLTSPSNQSAVFTFVYTEALFNAPTLTANFVASPFAADEIGEFNGLVTPSTGTVSSNSTQGSMKLTLTKTGSFSGTLLIDGFKLTIPASSFSSNGVASFGTTGASKLSVARTNKPSLELSNVVWNQANNTISGIVKQYYRSAVSAECEFILDRAFYSSTNKLAANSPYLTNAGLFTVILPSKSQTNGLIAVDYPQGDGVGAITISNTGIVKLTGKLADDTAITASAPLSQALKAPLFAQLYTNKGSFSASVQLNSAAADSDLKAVDCVWFRPWQNVQWYPWGWEEGVKVDLYGASYVKTGTVIPGLPNAPNVTTANAELTFNDGQLDESVTGQVNISPTNVVKTTAGGSMAATAFKVTLKAATGDISGTFTHTNGTVPTFVGKVYQKGPNAGTYGYFMTAKPKVVDGLGESGGFSLAPLNSQP